jgi:hypothetical protein
VLFAHERQHRGPGADAKLSGLAVEQQGVPPSSSEEPKS